MAIITRRQVSRIRLQSLEHPKSTVKLKCQIRGNAVFLYEENIFPQTTFRSADMDRLTDWPLVFRVVSYGAVVAL